jgi:pyruvate kinase
MMSRLRPTRSEVCDIANGVEDGLDGLILSAETAVGSFPIEATIACSKVCIETENNMDPVHLYQEQQGLLKDKIQLEIDAGV